MFSPQIISNVVNVFFGRNEMFCSLPTSILPHTEEIPSPAHLLLAWRSLSENVIDDCCAMALRVSENRGQRSKQTSRKLRCATSDTKQNPKSTFVPNSTCWFLSNLKTVHVSIAGTFSTMFADPLLHFFAHYCHLFISGMFLNPLVLACSSTPTQSNSLVSYLH